MNTRRGAFAKVHRSLWDGTLGRQPGPAYVFVFLLAHSSADGIVDITVEQIAARCHLPLEEVRAAIAVLEAVDPESRSSEKAGARIVRLDDHRSWGWRIVNHAAYRRRTKAERDALYRARHREEIRERDRTRKRSRRARP